MKQTTENEFGIKIQLTMQSFSTDDIYYVYILHYVKVKGFPAVRFYFLVLTPDDKIFVCEFSKKITSKLYHIESSKTGGQTL